MKSARLGEELATGRERVNLWLAEWDGGQNHALRLEALEKNQSADQGDEEGACEVPVGQPGEMSS